MEKASVVRFVGLIIVMVNAFLNLIGYETIPTKAGEWISGLVLLAWGLWASWKNNYLSSKGKAQKSVLKKHDLD